jgi:hypothetical protein
MIHESLRTVVVPETFKEADNFIGLYTLKAARKLGYTVRFIPYVGAKNDIPKDIEEISLGIYMSLSDSEANFRFTKKIDNYEKGRTFARSQAILGALLSNGMDSSLLKENHTYFGNFKPKAGADDKDKKPKEDYWIHTLPSFILEKDLAQECAKVILTIMRQSWALLNPSTLWNNMVPHVVPYGTIVRENCAKEVVVEPAKGKKKAVTAKKVPQKVRSNALLLSAELSIINRYAEPLFKPTPFENLSQDEWVQSVWANGLPSIKKDLSTQYGLRATFLSRLASLTTKRLRLLRATSETHKTKRKADVTVSDLSSLLLGRVNPVQDFAQEILSLDPTGELFLKEYFLGEQLDWSKVGGGSNLLDQVKEKIALDIDSIGVYSELLSEQQEKRQQIALFLASYKLKEDARNAFFLDLQNKYGANLVNKWHANVLTYDFPEAMAAKGKISNKGKKDPRHPQVPHEPKKSQGEAKKAKPKKQKFTFTCNSDGVTVQGASDELSNLISELWELYPTFSENPRQKIFFGLERLLKDGKALPKEFSEFNGYLSREGNDRNTLWKDISVCMANMSIPTSSG